MFLNFITSFYSFTQLFSSGSDFETLPPPPGVIRQCLGTLLSVTFWVGDVEGAPGTRPVEARDAATNLTMHQEAPMTENYLIPNVHSV